MAAIGSTKGFLYVNSVLRGTTYNLEARGEVAVVVNLETGEERALSRDELAELAARPQYRVHVLIIDMFE